MSAGVSKRWVKVDPFAITDLGMEHSLTSSEMSTLFYLALRAEYRSGEWMGTKTDLCGITRLGRNTVSRVVDALLEKGLLESIQPFRGGTEGRVRVVHHRRLVQVNLRTQNAPIDANSARSAPVGFDSDSRPARAQSRCMTRMTRKVRTTAR